MLCLARINYEAFFAVLWRLAVVGCRRRVGGGKEKIGVRNEPITQSITNRCEHSSRFKAMFYVIGSEDQSRVLLSTAPANRTKGVVEQFGTFRSTESVSDKPDISQYGRTVYSVVYVCVDKFSTVLFYKK